MQTKYDPRRYIEETKYVGGHLGTEIDHAIMLSQAVWST